MICIIRLVACASRPTDAAALASRLLISCSCLFGWAPPIVLGYSVVGWLRLHLFSIFPTIAVLRRARVRRNVTASYCTGRLSLRFNYVVVFHLHRKGLPFFFASQLQLSCAWHMSPSIIRTRRKMRGGGGRDTGTPTTFPIFCQELRKGNSTVLYSITFFYAQTEHPLRSKGRN